MSVHWFRYNCHLPLGIWSIVTAAACSGAVDVGGGEQGTSTGVPDPSDSSSGDDDGAEPTDPTDGATTGEVDASTTGTSSGGDSTGTGDVNFCGDGIIDGDEACDLGEANSMFRFCTEWCQLNVCGDGFPFVGAELCDEGVANSDEYGSTCNSQCRPGARCGDGFLQADEGEQCDLGPGNDTDQVDDQGLKCSAQCRVVAYRGFITSMTFTGDLGGLNGLDDADEKCRFAAWSAGLPMPNNFRAFLSGDDVSANKRFIDRLGDPTPYLLLGGQVFAASYDELVLHGPGDAGISITEKGEPLVGVYVATNTRPDGEVFDPELSCASWQSASKDLKASVGINALPPEHVSWLTWKTEGWWASAETLACDKPYFHLYCLE